MINITYNLGDKRNKIKNLPYNDKLKYCESILIWEERTRQYNFFTEIVWNIFFINDKVFNKFFNSNYQKKKTIILWGRFVVLTINITKIVGISLNYIEKKS